MDLRFGPSEIEGRPSTGRRATENLLHPIKNPFEGGRFPLLSNRDSREIVINIGAWGWGPTLKKRTHTKHQKKTPNNWLLEKPLRETPIHKQILPEPQTQSTLTGGKNQQAAFRKTGEETHEPIQYTSESAESRNTLLRRRFRLEPGMLWVISSKSFPTSCPLKSRGGRRRADPPRTWLFAST